MSAAVQAAQLGDNLKEEGPSHSRAAHGRHSSDDMCRPFFLFFPSCLPFFPHPEALEGMPRRKKPLKSLASHEASHGLQRKPKNTWIVEISDLL